jgi:hypothetical protein
MMAEAKWCPKCKRIIGIGCACDDSFSDKVKTTATNLGTFRAVPKDKK